MADDAMTLGETPGRMHPRIQEVIDFLALHHRGVHDAVASVPAEQREQRTDPARWSVADVVEHLSLIEQRIAALVTMHVTAARAKGVGPDPETDSVVASFVDPDRVVDRTRKIEAPPHVRPSGTVNTTAVSEALDRAHASIVAALRDANGVSLENIRQKHPVLGDLNLYHWMVATGLHDARHAEQIREIGRTLAAT
jgi:hypothetical protein